MDADEWSLHLDVMAPFLVPDGWMSTELTGLPVFSPGVACSAGPALERAPPGVLAPGASYSA